MGGAVILVMWPRPPEQTFVPSSYGGSIWNMALIGPAVSEEVCMTYGQRSQSAYTHEPN